MATDDRAGGDDQNRTAAKQHSPPTETAHPRVYEPAPQPLGPTTSPTFRFPNLFSKHHEVKRRPTPPPSPTTARPGQPPPTPSLTPYRARALPPLSVNYHGEPAGRRPGMHPCIRRSHSERGLSPPTACQTSPPDESRPRTRPRHPARTPIILACVRACPPKGGRGKYGLETKSQLASRSRPAHSAAGSHQAGISSERGQARNKLAPVHNFRSVGILQRVNLLRLRVGTRSARMQVGRCERDGAQ